MEATCPKCRLLFRATNSEVPQHHGQKNRPLEPTPKLVTIPTRVSVTPAWLVISSLRGYHYKMTSALATVLHQIPRHPPRSCTRASRHRRPRRRPQTRAAPARKEHSHFVRFRLRIYSRVNQARDHELRAPALQPGTNQALVKQVDQGGQKTNSRPHQHLTMQLLESAPPRTTRQASQLIELGRRILIQTR